MTPASTIVETIAGLRHEYRAPPSSSAKTNSTEAARSSKTPSMSIRWNDAFENLLERRAASLRSPDEGRNIVTREIAIAPPGALISF